VPQRISPGSLLLLRRSGCHLLPQPRIEAACHAGGLRPGRPGDLAARTRIWPQQPAPAGPPAMAGVAAWPKKPATSWSSGRVRPD